MEPPFFFPSPPPPILVMVSPLKLPFSLSLGPYVLSHKSYFALPPPPPRYLSPFLRLPISPALSSDSVLHFLLLIFPPPPSPFWLLCTQMEPCYPFHSCDVFAVFASLFLFRPSRIFTALAALLALPLLSTTGAF